MQDTNLILDNQQINHKIRRMAYQILEVNLKEDKIILAGIVGGGYTLAQKLKRILNKIDDIEVILCKVSMDKKKPLGTVTTSMKPEEYQNQSITLVDDVLNSGTTLIYGVKHFLDVPLKKFKTAVLVNRNHKKYPIKADFKGISLSTSLNEHIEVTWGTKSTVVLQ